mmetsp:Transcript_53561/g.148942  ORF Transcript_53561/g.148942 Transcript_53561/m.148942 type:complete len:646 (+) Transcript_53561:82-2019(+)
MALSFAMSSEGSWCKKESGWRRKTSVVGGQLSVTELADAEAWSDRPDTTRGDVSDCSHRLPPTFTFSPSRCGNPWSTPRASESTETLKTSTVQSPGAHTLDSSRPPTSVRSGIVSNFFSSRKLNARSQRVIHIPIDDHTLLRGTPPSVLLECFGKRLRGSAGGLGSVSQEGDAEYAKSYVVNELDVFLSHSWHAPWFQKYVLLLLQFNLLPSLTVAIVVGVLLCIMQRRFNRLGDGEVGLHFSFMGPCVVCGGLASFVGTLLSWHWIFEKVGACRAAIFLDKVCIHQSDIQRKEQGIKSICAIVDASKSMLVAWDPTYFTRLWCVYEISAFKFANADANLVIRSMHLPHFLGAFGYVSNLAFVVYHLLSVARYWEAVVLVFFTLPISPVVFGFRMFAKERKDLKSQLRNFSICDTESFCCANKHVHPETGMNLICDRTVVYNSIAQWYGNGNIRIGLQKFDEMIRGRLKEDLHRTLGKSWKIPYKYTLVVGLPPFLLHLIWSTSSPLWFSLAVACEVLVLRFPLCVAFTLFLCHMVTYDDSVRPRWVERLIDVMVAIVSGLFVGMGSSVAELTHLFGAAFFAMLCILELLGVLFFYIILARIHFNERWRQLRSKLVDLRDRIITRRRERSEFSEHQSLHSSNVMR